MSPLCQWNESISSILTHVKRSECLDLGLNLLEIFCGLLDGSDILNIVLRCHRKLLNIDII